MPRYMTTAPTFIAPALIPEGKVIEYDGPPGPHLQPLDAEATARTEKYYNDNPSASLNPTESLSRTIGGERPRAASAAVIQPMAPAYARVVGVPGVGQIGDPGKPTPGLTDGGALLDDAVRDNDRGGMFIQQAVMLPPGYPVPDQPGFGSNGERAEFTMEQKPPYPNNRAGDPANTDKLGGDPYSASTERTPAAKELMDRANASKGDKGDTLQKTVDEKEAKPLENVPVNKATAVGVPAEGGAVPDEGGAKPKTA